MSIEGGARVGYVNPDATTFEYLKGRELAPKGEAWDRALAYFRSVASDADATYDDVVKLDAADIAPTVTWGINPGQAVSIGERVPTVDDGATDSERDSIKEALDYMQLEPGKPIEGVPVNVAFNGSCTNGRLSDFREVARHIRGKKVAASVRALAVPGSMEAGFQRHGARGRRHHAAALLGRLGSERR
jgi:3-isopropylmalate/(R)-2-methylmalate dehydratase large subunit